MKVLKATRELLELSNEFGKVSGYKINIQKSVAFLYTNSKVSEREIKEIILFTITSKRMDATFNVFGLILSELVKVLRLVGSCRASMD